MIQAALNTSIARMFKLRVKRGFAIDRKGQEDQSRYVKSQRKEGDVAGGRCKRRCVERAERALQQGSGHALEPAPFGTIQTRQQHVLQDESCAEQNGKTAQEPTRVE